MKFVRRDDIAVLGYKHLPDIINVYGKEEHYFIGERIIINRKYVYTIQSYEVDLEGIAIFKAKASGKFDCNKNIQDKPNITVQRLNEIADEIISEKVDEAINKKLKNLKCDNFFNMPTY